MITKTCEVCQSSFEVGNYRANTARFCSQVCGGKWHMANRSMPNEHKKGNTWRAGLRPTNAFTSEQAKIMNFVQGEIHKCAECSTDFEIKPWIQRQNKSKSGMRFCCKRCHSAYMEREQSGVKSAFWVGGITTYRGKGWLEARMIAIERDSGVCQSCKSVIGESIPVHHIRPFRLFQTAAEANQPANLECLCQPCHMRKERAVERQLRALSAHT